MTRTGHLKFAPVAAGLLLGTLVLGACAKPPPRLSKDDFEDLVDGDECEESCGGALTATGWFRALGWQLDSGATLDSTNESLTIEGRGGAVVTAWMPATTWTGGATFEIDLATSGASTGAEVRVGPRSRAGDGSATLVFNPVTQSVHAEIVVGETTATTSPLAYAIAGAHVELEVGCARATITADGESATVRLDAAPSLDVFEIVVTGQVKVNVAEVTLETGCKGGESVPKDPCEDSSACLTADWSALGACIHTPATEATLCSDGNICTQGDACDGQGVCLSGESENDCVPNLEGYEDAIKLSMFEPAHDEGSATPLSLLPTESVNGKSSVVRVNEPVALALKSGVIDDSVIVYLPCDGSLTDVMGTLELPDTSTFNPGKYGKAVKGDQNEAVASTVAPEKGARTMMAWLRRSPGEGPGPDDEPANILGFATSATPPNAPPPEGHFRFGYGDFGYHLRAGSQQVLIQAEVASAGFHHVAATWDPESNTGVVYFDGLATRRFSDLEPTTVAAFRLGIPDKGGTEIDDVVYLNRAMSGAEIAAVVLTGQPFGEPLLAVNQQPDYDDLRVTTYDNGTHTEVDHEIVGRRVLSDTGKNAATVAAYYRFDGDDAPTLGGIPTTASKPSGESLKGAFGDVDGAMKYDSQGPTLWSGREFVFDGAFSVELWFKTLEEQNGTCKSLVDGAYLLQTLRSATNTESGDGWQLRLCDGMVRYDQGSTTKATVTLTGGPQVGDLRWHHALVTRTAQDTVTLFVDGLPVGTAISAAALLDSMSPVTALFAPGGGASATRAALDELVIHSTAKSAAYAYGRVYPRLPTLRFNVSSATQGPPGEFLVPRYSVHAGNPEAKALDTACAGALMACDKTEAWWRFNQLTADGVTVDSGPRGMHAQLNPSSGRLVIGPAGMALSMEGLQSVVAELIESAGPGAELGQWTVEALVSTPTELGTTQTLLTHGPLDGSGPYFELRINDKDEVMVETSVPDGQSSIDATSPGTIQNFEWTTVGCALTGDGLVAFTDQSTGGGPTVPPETVEGPLPINGQLTFGNGTDGLQGYLDEVRITGRALSQDERLKYPRLSVSASTSTPNLPPGPAP